MRSAGYFLLFGCQTPAAAGPLFFISAENTYENFGTCAKVYFKKEL